MADSSTGKQQAAGQDPEWTTVYHPGRACHRGFGPSRFRMGHHLFLLLMCGLAVCLARPLTAAPPLDPPTLARIPDNSWARQKLSASLLDPVSQLAPERGRILTQVTGPRSVKFRVIRNEAAQQVHLVFLNQVDSGYPDTAPGNVIIRRDLRGGGVDQVKIFLANDPLIYLRLAKSGSLSLLSVYFRDNQTPLYRDLPIPMAIERVALTPVGTLLKMTDARVAWRLFLERPDAGFYEDSRTMIQRIRGALPYLPDADDGAMDENGQLVRIDSITSTGQAGFNCSGFAKWVADGLHHPLTGRYLPVAALKERLLSLRDNPAAEALEESRDPWFGLDWIRNLGSRLAAARQTPGDRQAEDWDVRKIAFLEYSPRVDNELADRDRGYPIGELEKALFLLAIQEPGHFYMAAINGEFGSHPVLWQYFHVVVLFPYFDQAGRFRCAVFERNRESSLASLASRYPKEFAHLVRFRASGDFETPRIR